MNKNRLLFGFIAGVIICTQMVYSVYQCCTSENWEPNEVGGYAGMIVAFSMVFVGIKRERDSVNNGFISFRKAFLTGLSITLVASIMYAVVWLVDYYAFFPDFMDKYSEFVLKKTANEGGEVSEKAKEMETFKDWYKNPLMVVLLTFMEVFPLGLVISLICALILKRRPATSGQPAS